VTFATPGTGYLFPVAADVSSLSVVLLGGADGGVADGYGARVTATLDVAGTSSLGIDVGGAAAGASGGINGGGDGGAYTGSGGATDLTVSGTRLLVAGGNAGSPGANAVGVSEGGLVMTPGLGGTAGTVSGPGQGGEGGSVTTDPSSGAITNGDAGGTARRQVRAAVRARPASRQAIPSVLAAVAAVADLPTPAAPGSARPPCQTPGKTGTGRRSCPGLTR
jgi:hypothetical protein